MRAPRPSLSGTTQNRDGIRPEIVALAMIAVASVVRIVLGFILPMGVDEAYSLGVARQFSLSYFDHPPLHLWLVGLWGQITGSDDIGVLRLPFIALGAVSGWLMFGLARALFGARAGLWALALLTIAPVFGLAHAAMILPDGPLIAAALGTAWVIAAIVFERREGIFWWVLAGVLAGLALLSKYHGVLLVAGVLLFFISNAGGRAMLHRPGPWLAALIAAAMSLPIVIWNAQHDWVSFRFQGGRGLSDGGPVLANLWESLTYQAGYLLPWVAFGLLVALIVSLMRGPRDARSWYLVCLAIMPIVLFTTLTLFSRGLPHWQMPGWLFTIPLLATAIERARPWLRRVALAIVVASAVLVVALGGIISAQARWGSFDALTYGVFHYDPTKIIPPWDSLSDEMARRQVLADDRIFIASFSWITAGELNALFGRDVPVLCLCDDARHLAYLHDASEFAGWSAVLIDEPGRLAGNVGRIAVQFGSASEMTRLDLTKAGKIVLPLGLIEARDFKP